MRKIIFILLVLFVGYATKSYAYNPAALKYTISSLSSAPAKKPAAKSAATTSSITNSSSNTPITPTDIPNDGKIDLGKLGHGYTYKTIKDVSSFTAPIKTAAMSLMALTFTILLGWLGIKVVLGEKVSWMKEFFWLLGSLLFFAGYDKIGTSILYIIDDLQNKILSTSIMSSVFQQINLLLGLTHLESTLSKPHSGNMISSAIKVVVSIAKTAVNILSDLSPIGWATATIAGWCQELSWVFFAIRTILLAMMIAVAPIVAALSIVPPYRKLLTTWLKDFIEIGFWKFIISMMFYVVFEAIKANGGNWAFGPETLGLMIMLIVLIYSTPKIASMAIHKGMSGMTEIIGLGAMVALGKSALNFMNQSNTTANATNNNNATGKVDLNPKTYNTPTSLGSPSSILNSNLSSNDKLSQLASSSDVQISNIAKAALNGNASAQNNALNRIANITGSSDINSNFNAIKGDVNIGNLNQAKNNLENLALNPNLTPDMKAKVGSSLGILNSDISNPNKLKALNHITGLTTNDSYKNELQNALKSPDPLNEIKNNLPFASQNANISNTVGTVSGIVNSNMSDNNKISALNHISGLSSTESFSNDIQNILHNNDPLQAVNEVQSSLTYASQNPNLTNSAGTVDSIINSSISAPEKVNALNLVTTNETNYKSSLSTILKNSNYDEVITKITSDSSYISQNTNLSNINNQINNVIKNSSTNEVKINELRKLI